MKDEYNIQELNPRKNPYLRKKKQQISIYLDAEIVQYFKEQAEDKNMPYQTLINLYLADCVSNKKQLVTSWK